MITITDELSLLGRGALLRNRKQLVSLFALAYKQEPTEQKKNGQIVWSFYYITCDYPYQAARIHYLRVIYLSRFPEDVIRRFQANRLTYKELGILKF